MHPGHFQPPSRCLQYGVVLIPHFGQGPPYRSCLWFPLCPVGYHLNGPSSVKTPANTSLEMLPTGGGIGHPVLKGHRSPTFLGPTACTQCPSTFAAYG